MQDVEVAMLLWVEVTANIVAEYAKTRTQVRKESRGEYAYVQNVKVAMLLWVELSANIVAVYAPESD